jgi:hypothetical protein
MIPKRHDLRWFVTGLLFSVVFCEGCASLKPNTANVPPETGGGLGMSDEGAAVLSFLGPGFYILGEWLAGSSECHK